MLVPWSHNPTYNMLLTWRQGPTTSGEGCSFRWPEGHELSILPENVVLGSVLQEKYPENNQSQEMVLNKIMTNI